MYHHVKSIKTNWVRLFATVALMLPVIQGAYAQSPSPAQGSGLLEELVVTAQKREQTISEIPISMAAFSGQQLEDAGVDGFEDLSQLVANFNFYSGYSATQTSFNIRGLTSGTENPGIDPSVGFFIDGVYIDRPGALLSKLTDIERVEVLRGPQGTLYGRNTSAGAVNLYTKKPGQEFESEVFIGAGNYGLIDTRAYVAGGLTEKTAASFSFYYEDRDLFIDDIAGGPAGETETIGGRLKLVSELSDSLSLVFSADASSVEGTGTSLLGLQAGFPVTTPLMPFDYEKSRTPEDEFDNIDQEGVSLELNYEMAGGTLTSITAYRNTEIESAVDVDMLVPTFLVSDRRTDTDQFSQEIRFASDLQDSDFEYLIGLFYYDSDNAAFNDTLFGLPLINILTGGMVPPFVTGDQTSNSSFDTSTEAMAVFGQLSYNVTDALKVTYGFRYNDEEREGLINQQPDPLLNLDGPAPGGFGLQFPTIVPGDEGSMPRFEDDTFTDMLSLNYEFGEASNLYLTYSEGVKSGGINSNIVSNIDLITFDNEESTNYEIGYRNQLGDNFRFNLALFKTDFEGLQLTPFDPTNPGSIIVFNAGDAEVSGFEGDFLWAVNEAFTLSGSFGYNDTEYVNADESVPVGSGFPRSLDGQSLGRAPEITAALGASYSWDIGDSLTATLRADYSYTDEQVLDVLLDPLTAIDSYSLLNLRATLESSDGRWAASVWGRNVTDEEYLIQALISPGRIAAPLGVPSYIGAAGAPATYGLDLKYRF